jgi:hypothetical protein
MGMIRDGRVDFHPKDNQKLEEGDKVCPCCCMFKENNFSLIFEPYVLVLRYLTGWLVDPSR